MYQLVLNVQLLQGRSSCILIDRQRRSGGSSQQYLGERGPGAEPLVREPGGEAP